MITMLPIKCRSFQYLEIDDYSSLYWNYIVSEKISHVKEIICDSNICNTVQKLYMVKLET